MTYRQRNIAARLNYRNLGADFRSLVQILVYFVLEKQSPTMIAWKGVDFRRIVRHAKKVSKDLTDTSKQQRWEEITFITVYETLYYTKLSFGKDRVLSHI
jgi:hypothetical protein